MNKENIIEKNGKEMVDKTESNVKETVTQEVVLINEETIRDKIYTIRGQKVMLDTDLSRIYGYSTKAFNQQVKRNIERFPEDFMFELTDEETLEISRSQFVTLNEGVGRGHNIKYNPHVFTEQGIYMLMTVLKGDLAVHQSIELIRIFKNMKDYIIENQGLIGQREYIQLSMQVTDSVRDTTELRIDLIRVEDQMSDLIDRLSNVVTKSELSDIMNKFGKPQVKRGYILLNGQPFKADLAYSQIYEQAQKSIYVVDNYIGVKTLALLKNSNQGVNIILFSDNIGKKLHATEFEDFCKEYPDCRISLQQSGGIFHDRYIILDYGTDDEKIYLCGSSSKDSGNRVTTILEDPDREKYQNMIRDLLRNDSLIL